jgi:hypothetical protein
MPIFFAENCQKSQKIVIITSTPGVPNRTLVPHGFPAGDRQHPAHVRRHGEQDPHHRAND